MSWWGKLLGGRFGFVLGGPLGALVGAALGHTIDAHRGGSPSVRERTQTAFFTATFSVLGHLAKADGRVTQDEIRLAEAVMAQMQLGDELRTLAKNLYRQGKDPGFALDEVLDQFRRECHRSRLLLRMFIEILLQAAYVDGVLHPAERAILLHICSRLGISPDQFAHLDAMVNGAYGRHPRGDGAHGDAFARAYAVLDVSPDANDDEIKRAYRRLVNQHHPDKLVAKGLPEEMMKLASEKTHEIRKAYERIRAARGF
ncbi:MAG: co-chaperone DjlA [Gammaproteobacteria bacterium]|nr:co-chaperone DjlA [Gammaproteobacteria bacterium]